MYTRYNREVNYHAQVMNFSPELRSQLLTPQLIWFALDRYYQVTYQEAIALKIDPWWSGVRVSLKSDFCEGFSTIISYRNLAEAIETYLDFKSNNCSMVSRNGNLATVRGTQGSYHCTTGTAGKTCTCKLYRCMNNRLVRDREAPRLLKNLLPFAHIHNGKPQLLCHHLRVIR